MDAWTRTEGKGQARARIHTAATLPGNAVRRFPELRRERAPSGDLAEDIRTLVLFALRCHVRARCRGERSPGAPWGGGCTSVSVIFIFSYHELYTLNASVQSCQRVVVPFPDG